MRSAILFGAVCFAAAELGYRLTVALGAADYPVIWVPLGVLTAALLVADVAPSLADARDLQGTVGGRWRALTIAAAAAMLASGIGVHGHQWQADIVFAAITIAQAWAGALIVRRAVDGPFTITQVSHVWTLALVSMAVAAAGSLLTAMTVDAGSTAGWLIAWRARLMSDLDSLLLITPAAVGFIAVRSLSIGSGHWAKRIEPVLATVAAVVLIQLIFGNLAPPVLRVPAYVLPLLLWIAFRCDAGDAAISICLVCVVGIWNTSEGRGPFALNSGSVDAWVLRAQGSAIATSLSITLLAAVVAERRRAAAERDRLVLELQQAIAEIKTLQGLIPLCAWCHKIRDDLGAWEGLETYIQRHTDATFSHSICPACMENFERERMGT